MDKIIRVMMDLIACEVFGKALDKTQCELSDDEMLTLYKLSKSHDLAHIVGDALTKNDLITNDEVRARRRSLSSICSDTHTRASITTIFHSYRGAESTWNCTTVSKRISPTLTRCCPSAGITPT